MKPIRIREESNPLENVSNSLLVSLILYEKALSSLCFFLSLLSREREKNYSFQTPLLLLLFVVLLLVLLRKNTKHHHQEGERKRVNFCLVFCFFFSRAASLFVCCFSSAFSLLLLSCALVSLSLHIFFVRENTHHNNTRPKIMVRSLYT